MSSFMSSVNYLPSSISSAQMYSSLSTGPITPANFIRKSSGRRSKIGLQRVPENQVVESANNDDNPNVTSTSFVIGGEEESRLKETARGEDWINLQRCVIGLFTNEGTGLPPGELNILHKNMRNLLESKIGSFLFDYFKKELLTKGMVVLRNRIKEKSIASDPSSVLSELENCWDHFYTQILPLLEAIMYPVKTKRSQAIRRTSLKSFRDNVTLQLKLEILELNSSTGIEYPGIQQMFLVLQSVRDIFPPSQNKIQLENLVARIVIPYLGFQGLYNGKPEPCIWSSEPSILARKRSADLVVGRRISRPLSVQPKQLENLNDLFLMAIRKQQVSSFVR